MKTQFNLKEVYIMGQRSQMYVIAKKEGKYYLTANYYGWNYGERMISRVRGTLENILDEFIRFDWLLTTDNRKLRRIMDINWDMHDIVVSSDIVREFTDDYEQYWKNDDKTYAEDFLDFCFTGQDNNNGQAYMYIDLDNDNPKVKVCFVERTFEEGTTTMNAEEYLTKDLICEESCTSWKEYMINSEYYDDDDIIYTEKNIEYINQHSEFLSQNELLEILKHVASEYESQYNAHN